MHKFTLIPYMACGNLQNPNAFNEYLCSAFITIILTDKKNKKTKTAAFIPDDHECLRESAKLQKPFWPRAAENFKRFRLPNFIICTETAKKKWSESQQFD